MFHLLSIQLEIPIPKTFQVYDFDNFSKIKWQSLQISVKIMSVKWTKQTLCGKTFSKAGMNSNGDFELTIALYFILIFIWHQFFQLVISIAAIHSHNYTIEFDMNWQSHFWKLKLNYESQIVKLYLASFKPQFPERIAGSTGLELRIV